MNGTDMLTRKAVLNTCASMSHIFLLFVCLILSQSCSETKMRTVYSSDVKDSSQVVDLEQLLKNPDIFKNKIIETVGIFQTGFEESAIYIDNSSLKRKKTNQALWMTFNEDYYPLINNKTGLNLLDSYQSIEKIQGCKIKVRGKFNLNSKGHLGLFFGSIENVFYLEVLIKIMQNYLIPQLLYMVCLARIGYAAY